MRRLQTLVHQAVTKTSAANQLHKVIQLALAILLTVRQLQDPVQQADLRAVAVIPGQ